MNFGILTLGKGARFALTPLGETLRSDAPGFARSTASNASIVDAEPA